MKLKWKEEAVSPVIATILMVAITVVLAAVLYVMVIQMPSDTGTAEQPIGLVQQARNATTLNVLIAYAPSGALVDGCTISLTHDDTPSPAEAIVYYANGTYACSYSNNTWEDLPSNTFNFDDGMLIRVTAAAVAHGDVLIMTGIGFGTTNFNID